MPVGAFCAFCGIVMFCPLFYPFFGTRQEFNYDRNKKGKTALADSGCDCHSSAPASAGGAGVFPPPGTELLPHLRKELSHYELERQVGAKRICWRYDPVLLTARYDIQTHMETFDYMAGRLTGHVNRCTFSFVEMYHCQQLKALNKNKNNHVES